MAATSHPEDAPQPPPPRRPPTRRPWRPAPWRALGAMPDGGALVGAELLPGHRAQGIQWGAQGQRSRGHGAGHQCFEGDGLRHLQRARLYAAQGRAMRHRIQRRPQVPGQRPHVRPGPAVHPHPQVGPVGPQPLPAVHAHGYRWQLQQRALPGEGVCALAGHMLGRVGWRALEDHPGERRERRAQRGIRGILKPGGGRHGGGTHHAPGGVVGIGGDPQADGRLVHLGLPLHPGEEPSDRPHRHHEQPRGKRVQGPGMPDPTRAGGPARGRDDIVRGATGGLVHQQEPRRGAGRFRRPLRPLRVSRGRHRSGASPMARRRAQ